MINAIRHALGRIFFFLRSSQLEEDFSSEMNTHLELAIEENLKLGMTPTEARRTALLDLGGVQQTKETVRDHRGIPFLETLLQDLRFSLRMLRKNPGFTAVAILTLALSIGANTALFSIVNAVLLNPLPYDQPYRLLAVYARTPQFKFSSISYPNFLDWRRDNRTFAALAAFRGENFNLTGMGTPERVDAEMVSATFFPLLGVRPVAGRVFFDQEDQVGAAPVALITEGFWKRKFASSPDAIGKSLALNGKLYEIIGVIPRNFLYENNNFHSNSELYVPIGQWNDPLFRDRRVGMGTDAVGRLKPGVTFDQAKSDMDSVANHLAEVFPDVNKNSGINMVPLKENVVGDIRPSLLVLFAAVGFVLLIACANVANLLLARSTGRTREFAIRTALGASKSRVVRQLLTESVLLGIAGGALGVCVAGWGTKAAIRILPDALPRAQEIHLDPRVLLFTLAISVLSGICFGLVPAFKSSGAEIQDTLKKSGRGGSASRHRTQGVFVAMEMAMAVVLLVGAGLMIRSLANLWAVDPGFDPHNVLNFSIASSEPLGANPAASRSMFRQLHDAISTVPGVQSASLQVGSTPMSGDSELPFWLDGEPKPTSQSEMKVSLMYIAQPDYLKVMKIPLKRGRFLETSDSEHAHTVLVIDEQFAKLYFGDKDPIGRRVNLEIVNSTAEIVGVVGHIKQWGLDSDSTSNIQAQCYLAMDQLPDSILAAFGFGTDVYVRTDGTPMASIDSISRGLEKVNSRMVLYGTRTMTGIISDSLSSKRFVMVLLGVFAALAMLLSSIGIYGVLSYVVGQRTNEIGIRMALGADRFSVLRMVLGQAGKMVMVGVVIGMVAALLLTRLMSTILFGVSPSDPLTLAAVAFLLTAVALFACYIPARRATKVDPMIALRYL
jgi:predicted permease